MNLENEMISKTFSDDAHQATAHIGILIQNSLEETYNDHVESLMDELRRVN